MCDQNKDEITDFASFQLHYKQKLPLHNEDESGWRCAEGDGGIYLFVLDESLAAGTVQKAVPGPLPLTMVRHCVVIDNKLNLKIDSKDKDIQVSLPAGELLTSYAQLLTIMYVLTEASYEEEYLDEEWEEIEESHNSTIEVPPIESPQEDRLVHRGNKNFKCSYCPKTFARSIRQQEHENVHTGRKPYVCTVCSRAFSASSSYIAHAQLHNGVRNHACPGCDKKFHRKRNMMLHHKLVHLKEKPYACPICQRPYTNPACLKRHIVLHTEETNTKPASVVSSPSATTKARKEKTSRRLLKRASEAPKPPSKGVRRKRDTLPKRYPCELCGLMFARRRNVEYHVKYTHTGIKPYECEFCAKKYSDITSFKRHIRAHTDISGEQVAIGEELAVQRKDTAAQGDHGPVTVMQDIGQNSVITSYIVLNSTSCNISSHQISLGK